MYKVIIVDTSESDRRLMSGLLTRAGYEPIAVDKMEAAKDEVAKLPPGAVVVASIKFTDGTAQGYQMAKIVPGRRKIGRSIHLSRVVLFFMPNFAKI